MHSKIKSYVERWLEMGYPQDIPDEVPEQLRRLGLAPSYQAIAYAILKNDHALTSLGFSPPYSRWYMELKRVEIEKRERKQEAA